MPQSEVQSIRALHPYAFRCCEWATLLTTCPDPEGKDCYLVEFEDGETDFWRVDDPAAAYQFADGET